MNPTTQSVLFGLLLALQVVNCGVVSLVGGEYLYRWRILFGAGPLIGWLTHYFTPPGGPFG